MESTSRGAIVTDRMWDEGGSLSPELRALLACARWVLDRECRPEAFLALEACADVDHLCKTAVSHGMLGHLQRLVAGREGATEPSGLAQRLAELQRVSAQRALRQTGSLLRVLERLREAGVTAMPLKGPAWAERLYGDVTLRTWEDLDVLVSHDQVPQARAALLAEGFVDAGPFNARLASSETGGWGQIAFTAGTPGVQLEIHWEVTSGFSATSLRPESLFARAVRMHLLDREALTPHPVDLLLITCLNGARDRWNAVERMLGLAVQVRDTDPGDWPHVIAAAREAGCRRRVATAIGHVCRVFGLPVPGEVAKALFLDALARALVRSLRPDTLDRGLMASPRRHLGLLRWRFATEDSLAAGLGHATVRFFRPGPEDWQSLRLPAAVWWLYYPLRPARLGLKWVGHLLPGDRGPMKGL
jgi:hypothetical protein